MDRPTWRALAAGARPEQPEASDVGEWTHGWQFRASDALEQQEYTTLLRALRGRGRFGPLPDPARLRSCSGRN
eukprot:6684502-Karenia_brevis.AAC.1